METSCLPPEPLTAAPHAATQRLALALAADREHQQQHLTRWINRYRQVLRLAKTVFDATKYTSPTLLLGVFSNPLFTGIGFCDPFFLGVGAVLAFLCFGAALLGHYVSKSCLEPRICQLAAFALTRQEQHAVLQLRGAWPGGRD